VSATEPCNCDQALGLQASLDVAEARIQQLETDVRTMVQKAADKSLAGYRELGDAAAKAENERDEALARVQQLESRVLELEEDAAEMRKELDEARERVAETVADRNEYQDANDTMQARAAELEWRLAQPVCRHRLVAMGQCMSCGAECD
jgi:chromosome segregation ATPase